jgi:hypothetical protein
MLLNSVLGIHEVPIVVIWVDQRVHRSIVLLHLGRVLEPSHGHSEGVMENVVVVSEVVHVSPDHRGGVVVVQVVVLVSQSDQFPDLAASGAPL